MTVGQPRSALRAFIRSEAAGAILLMLAAAAAMLVANSGLSPFYHLLLDTPVGPAPTAKLGLLTPHLVIDDGLMAIFFLFIGLEIKREPVEAAKLGTFAGSLLSTLAGYALLRAAPLHRDHAREEAEQGPEITDGGKIAAFGDEEADGAIA